MLLKENHSILTTRQNSVDITSLLDYWKLGQINIGLGELKNKLPSPSCKAFLYKKDIILFGLQYLLQLIRSPNIEISCLILT